MRAITSLAPALERAADAAAAARIVVEHLATEPQLLPSVYLERGGRLRCAAAHGHWQARDGVPPGVGVIGRAYRTASEVVIGASDEVAEACVPVVACGRTIGVLNLESPEPLRDGDLDNARACAIALGRRIEALGGLPSESTTRRLLRHVTAMAALQDARAIADALLRAALDLVPLDSAVLVRTTPSGDLVPAAATGPLSPVLLAGRLEQLVALVHGGVSCFTFFGAPDAPAATHLTELRAAGVESLVAAGLFAQEEMLGMLVMASADSATVDTNDVELLEQLAAHAAACLRTVEVLGALRQRAATDPLTGLGHHATFHEALAAAHRRPTTAVVVCDIDGFKHLNDAYGHGYGDRVLREVADAMSNALRRGDQLFRIGGDEFAALLAVESETEAVEAATRLREAVNHARLGVTLSIGVAVPQHGEPDASVLARADRALYAVKAGGRDGVALANDEPLPATPAFG